MNPSELGKTISTKIILDSELISAEESSSLLNSLNPRSQVTAVEILELDLPAKNRVDALLRYEFLEERQLRELACDFIEHTLHIFAFCSPQDHLLHNCVRVARMNIKGVATLAELEATILEAIPAVWRFERTQLASAFEVGLATTFLAYHDAAEMAQLIARHTQRAAHRKDWENRKSNIQPMTGREREAAWQLKHTVDTCFFHLL